MNTIDILEHYISEVLALPDHLRRAKQGEAIIVQDNSDSKEWKRFGRRAVQRFAKNWTIEQLPRARNVWLFTRK